MLRFLKRLRSGEKGQALAIILCLLAIGSLTIAVNLNYATTSLKGSGIVNEDVKGIYAAGAGVENVLWSLGKGSDPPAMLSQNINQMAVTMISANMGTKIFDLGQLTNYTGNKAGALSINGDLSPVVGNRYRYTITVTKNVTANLHLQEVGARIPVGYTYDDSATRNDSGTIGTGNPVQTLDSSGAWLLQFFWNGSNQPTGDNFILAFDITGTGSLGGAYSWTWANPTNSYGLYGEISGTWYQIKATAVRPTDNRTTARITTDIVKDNFGTITIISWQITK